MGRGSLAIIGGALLVLLFSIISGLGVVPPAFVIWIPFIGLLLGGIVIGVAGKLSPLHAILATLGIYVCAIALLAFIGISWLDVQLGPINLGSIYYAWIGFQSFFFSSFPPLQFFNTLGAILSTPITESIAQLFVENLILFSLFAIIASIAAALPAYYQRRTGIHVVTAPIVTDDEVIEAPSPIGTPMAPPTAAEPQYPPQVPAAPPSAPPQSPVSVPPSRSPPPVVPSMPESRPVEQVPSKGASPSAKAISSIKGDPLKKLKSSGKRAPTGQSRCPHCNATIIRGSRFCNACEKPIN